MFYLRSGEGAYGDGEFVGVNGLAGTVRGSEKNN